MNKMQKTIEKPIKFTGKGLHTGTTSTITFYPAPENHGIVFIRSDIDKNIEIPALVDYVMPDNGIDSLRAPIFKKTV